MNIVTVELRETSYTRFNCFYIEKFLKHHSVKYGEVDKRGLGVFYDCMVVMIDEESLFRIKLKYGTLQNAIQSYHKEMQTFCWKEYISSLSPDSLEKQSLNLVKKHMYKE